MKTAVFKLDNIQYYLFFNGEAYFRLRDMFGTENVFTVCLPVTKEGFDNLCLGVSVLAEQGELARRSLNYDAGDIPSREYLQTALTPENMTKAYEAFNTALELGFGREIEDDEDKEIDLVLQEIQKKRKNS